MTSCYPVWQRIPRIDRSPPENCPCGWPKWKARVPGRKTERGNGGRRTSSHCRKGLIADKRAHNASLRLNLPSRSGAPIIVPRLFFHAGVAMVAGRTLTRAAILVLMAAASVVWYACSDRASDSLAGPSAPPPVSARGPVPDLRAAMAAQRRHTDALLEIPGVVGTAVTSLPDGRAGMVILLERSGIAGLPQALDGVPVSL